MTRTITRHLIYLGLRKRPFVDPGGELDRKPEVIRAGWPGQMVHSDVKKVDCIPDGCGWRIHGRNSPEARESAKARTAAARSGDLFLHSAVDCFSRPYGADGDQPPVSRLRSDVTNVLPSYI